MPRRSTLAEYYRDLLTEEKLDFTDLAAEWPVDLVQDIREAMGSAYAKSGLAGSVLELIPGSTSQSAGNQVEKYIAPLLAGSLTVWVFEKCKGSGYPDRLLRNGALHLPVEVKSTGQWKDADSNRCVLTSSSQKLRSKFKAPIYHLLLTVKFSRTGDHAVIENLRLDFLSPLTPVNVRLEGSVTQRLLAEAKHPIFEF